MRHVVEMQDVRFRYAERAGFELCVARLRVERGERVACIGSSGCGKTTLINLMSGVLTPASGSIRLCGCDLTAAGEAIRRTSRLRHVGMVFQEFELLDYLSSLDNILLPYRIGDRAPLNEARQRARRLAHSLRIEHLLDRKPRALSQGERQRVSVCRALITRPSIIIGDEPTGSLDPENARGVIDLLLNAAADAGAALFVVTHDHTLLDRFDRVVHLGEGREIEG